LRGKVQGRPAPHYAEDTKGKTKGEEGGNYLVVPIERRCAYEHENKGERAASQMRGRSAVTTPFEVKGGKKEGRKRRGKRDFEIGQYGQTSEEAVLSGTGERLGKKGGQGKDRIKGERIARKKKKGGKGEGKKRVPGRKKGPVLL